MQVLFQPCAETLAMISYLYILLTGKYSLIFFNFISLAACIQVNDVKSKAHPSLIGKPLFNGTLSDKQWALLDEMQKEMQSEYQMRREMLIKRLDVTVQSFQVCFYISLYHTGLQ